MSDFGKVYTDRMVQKSLTDQAIDLINKVQQESVIHEVALVNLVTLADEVELMIKITLESIEDDKEKERS